MRSQYTKGYRSSILIPRINLQKSLISIHSSSHPVATDNSNYFRRGCSLKSVFLFFETEVDEYLAAAPFAIFFIAMDVFQVFILTYKRRRY